MARLEADNAVQIAEAMGFNELVTKSGYLVKRAKQSARNWKKRFFVLTGHSLSYYENNKSLTAAKGSFLLTKGTEVVAVSDSSYATCFEVASEFETMRVAAKDSTEVAEWIEAIESTIAELENSKRNYMEMCETGMFGTKWTKRFCMLHANSITIHQDHMHTFKNLGMIRITSGMKANIQDNTLEIVSPETGEKACILRASSAEEDPTGVLQDWQAAIERLVASRNSAYDLPVKPGEENTETTILDGYLKAQLAKGKWVPRFFALTTSAMYVAEDDSSSDALAVLPLNPSCSVFETNLKENAFELVTTQQALHVQGADAVITKKWIVALRNVISQSRSSRFDPLLSGAQKQDLDTYQVTFDEKKPLGIVLERSREWALVKLSNSEISAVSEGSALAAVNGESVTLMEYNHAIKLLAGWKPPLILTFIRAPSKEGFLGKMSRGRRRSVKNWKRRYFILKQGKLAYYSMDTESPELKGCVQLMGSAVSLVQADDIGQNFCFRVVSGVATLIMQAETMEEMMEWATTLYHAIAIANGGGYLLNKERKRATEREAQRAKEAKARAEAEAEERRRAAEEAELLRKEKEVAEEKARKEAEEAEAAAERARAQAEQDAAAALEAEATRQEAEEKHRVMQELDKEKKDAEAAAAAAEEEAEAAEHTVLGLQEEIDEAELAAEAIEQRLRLEDQGETTTEKRRRASLVRPPVLDDLEIDAAEDEADDGDAAASATAASKEPKEAGSTWSMSMFGARRRSTRVPSIQEPEPEVTVDELTEEEATVAFATLDTLGTGALNPMQFSNLLRASGVSTGNLHMEMFLYSKFDLDGKVGIGVNEITSGLRLLVRDKAVPTIFCAQLTNYLKDLGNSDAEKFSL